MRLYDLTRRLLVDNPIYRDSDKLLIWRVWEELGFVHGAAFTKNSFLNKRCPTPESITRCRRKIQEYHTELAASSTVQSHREEQYADKGNHIFKQVVSKVQEAFTPPVKHQHYEYFGNKAVLVDD